MGDKTGHALRWGGVLGWACALIPITFDPEYRQPALRALSLPDFSLWLLAYLTFGGTYGWVTRGIGPWMATGDRRGRPARLLGCGVMALCATVVNGIFSSRGDLTVLFVLLAALLPGLLTWSRTLVWITVQSAGLALALWDEFSLAAALYTSLFMGSVQVFTALLVQLVRRERTVRTELAELNVQFRFTRARLEEASREAERLRISRELHDSFGHHLTILGLELELAAHLPGKEVRASIERARTLNKLLLADVRESVSLLRTESADWRHLTQAVLKSVPGLRIHLIAPEQFNPLSAQQSKTLLRFFQEVMTNTVKHANASQLWLELERTPDGLRVLAHDDGHLRLPFEPGNGLTGLRERCEELGGTLVFKFESRGALRLEAHLPWRGPA